MVTLDVTGLLNSTLVLNAGQRFENGGQPITDVSDIAVQPVLDGAVVLKVPAGQYQFKAAYRP